MLDDPTSTNFEMVSWSVKGAGTEESNRYILVCSTLLPMHPQVQRRAQLVLLRLLPRCFCRYRHAPSVLAERWLFISTWTLTQRRAAATSALASGLSTIE